MTMMMMMMKKKMEYKKNGTASGSKKETNSVRRQKVVSYVVLMMNLSVCMEGEISQISHGMILIMLSLCYMRTICQPPKKTQFLSIN